MSVIIIVTQPDGLFDLTRKETELWPCDDDDGFLLPPPVCGSQGTSIFSSSSTRTSSSAGLVPQTCADAFTAAWIFLTVLSILVLPFKPISELNIQTSFAVLLGLIFIFGRFHLQSRQTSTWLEVAAGLRPRTGVVCSSHIFKTVCQAVLFLWLEVKISYSFSLWCYNENQWPHARMLKDVST